MQNLFEEKKNTTVQEKEIISIWINTIWKQQLKEIFNQRTSIISKRLNVVLTEEDIQNIQNNVWEMYNFHLTKLSPSLQVDFKHSDKLYFNIKKDKQGNFMIKNYHNLKIETNNLYKLKVELKKQLISDYSIAVKYCTLGYLAQKEKKKSYE
jgi:hypothetical protein